MLKQLRILHIWDIAGVAGIISKYQRESGFDSHVIKRAGYDPFGIDEYYNTELLDMSGLEFKLECIRRAKDYDIIHIHSFYQLVKYLRIAYPLKKIFIHYHGSDLRNKSKQHIIAQYMSSENFVSTRDLIQLCSVYPVYVPNPIDTELFSKVDTSNNSKWLTFLESGKFWHKPIDNIEAIDRSETPVRYDKMPLLLKQYHGYIDVKIQDGKPLESLSKTGLEALAMGLKVIDYRGIELSELPYYHNPSYVIKLLDKFYLGFYNHMEIPKTNFLGVRA